jgi:hypothetical protein
LTFKVTSALVYLSQKVANTVFAEVLTA